MIIMEKVDILGVPVDNTDMEGALARVRELLDGEGVSTVYTPNSEMVVNAAKDGEFMGILKSGDLVVPDGIGIVLASRIYGHPLPERVAGFDLMTRMLDMLAREGRRIFLFGGKPGIAEKAAVNISKIYPGISTKGIRDGYFKDEDVPGIVEQINSSGAEVLFVALGSPKQEKWIANHRERLRVKIAIGVGGSFDVLAGEAVRAPAFFRKAGLEWFYRLVTQPWRAVRMVALPVFVLKVLKDRGRRGKD
ncbi:MAG: WecB/TagA/CpsF family glycosyltransferase [Bacillota bacterium]|jgi:N-acetylglucosaminyldiphosphoundecaprenol N-acetyl-beta-D-mannosaminyltransferase